MPPNRAPPQPPLNSSKGATIPRYLPNGAASRKSASSKILRRISLRHYLLLIFVVGFIYFASISSLDLHLPRVLPSISQVLPSKPKPGSLYRSPRMFKKLWPTMQYVSNVSVIHTAWRHPKPGEAWMPCLDRPRFKELPPSNGYLMVEANGGLNQQRLSICNAVAVATLLNATLVIPGFHFNSVWQDASTFGEIYDEEHFINSLAEDVRIVKRLPDEIMEQVGHNMSNILKVKVKALANSSFYLNQVLPKLRETGVIRISPFAKRLAYNHIPLSIQRVRCFTNYVALRFAKPIADTSKLLVERMIQRSSGGDGKYIAVHLRYEKDMIAFSCCIYDGGAEEQREMDEAREKAWKGKFNRTGRVIDPAANRIDGQCPLTPLEIGMVLRGMGFTNSTPVYIASGDIYKKETSMLPLKQMFPRLQTKETLLSPEELQPFKNHMSRLAALDYTVCLHSEVFVYTQGSNFPHFLLGHRRFLNNGYSKTIKPDKRKLVQLLDNPKISWESFSRHLHAMRKHSDIKGHEIRKPEKSDSSIYVHPAPECMCPQH